MGEIVKAKDDIKRHVEEILVKVFSTRRDDCGLRGELSRGEACQDSC